MVIRFSATHFAPVDPNAPVVTNVEVRIGVIPIAATRCAAIQNVVYQDATDGVQNAVILLAARNVAPSVAPNAATRNVVSQAATDDFPNAAVLSVVLNVVQGVARGVVIQSAVTLYVRHAVNQCVANLDALFDSQDEVLPNDGQGVSPVDLLSLDAVQRAVAPDAAPFLAPALS